MCRYLITTEHLRKTVTVKELPKPKDKKATYRKRTMWRDGKLQKGYRHQLSAGLVALAPQRRDMQSHFTGIFNVISMKTNDVELFFLHNTGPSLALPRSASKAATPTCARLHLTYFHGWISNLSPPPRHPLNHSHTHAPAKHTTQYNSINHAPAVYSLPPNEGFREILTETDTPQVCGI
ncbi:PREDICTED: uncharacterized protein LOC108538541 isoform X2 [Rhinopithecus bieti]|uniref:uncharacterized protein LOC108538541 isoform X2 n=1 Tax=Rhinopithecus bieti TaxID=61621 RepID=UPI00083BCD31|nr:PREDICTED: uncharacterized protein LOC108538541 isoform X2 [Rhinopithecus bieti]